MDVVSLPDDLKTDNSSELQVFDYKTSNECFKQMVSLKQNTFSFLLEGGKEVFSDKTSISIQNSNFILMKSGNCLMTERVTTSSANYRSILFFFSNERLMNFLKKYKIENSIQSTNDSIFSFEYDTFLSNFVLSLIHISNLDIKIQSKLLELKFDELFIYLIETKNYNFIYALVSNIDSQTNHFIEVVETNKLNKLSLKELSFLSNRSVSTFKRDFEKHYEQSPSKWFQERRLEHAAYLLKNEFKRPSDIFEDVGYENLSNFIQAFKRKYDVTPKQYQAD
jgi:AraC-like DNA-binding protein